MKKTIISVALFSLLSGSVFAQTTDVAPQDSTIKNVSSKESAEDTYTRLNTEIAKFDNATAKKEFSSFYDKNHKRISEISKKNNDVKVSSSNELKPEMKSWNEINIASLVYFKKGFINEAVKKGEKSEQANKDFEILAHNTAKLWSDASKDIQANKPIKITSNDREFNNAVFYDFMEVGVVADNLSKQLSVCKQNDTKCVEDVKNKNKSIVSDDIFVNLTNECSDSSDIAACRVKMIKSSSFEQKLFYKNYLLGKYVFDYTQSHK